MMKEDNALTAGSQQSSRSQWVDAVVQAATTANNLFMKNSCRLCHAYTDKQVEFETGNEPSYTTSAAMESMLRRTTETAAMEVDLYRKFLFDEDSVVDNVSDREMRSGKAPDYRGSHENEYKYHPSQIHQTTSEGDVMSAMTQRTS